MTDQKILLKPEIKAMVIDNALLIKISGRGTVQNSSPFYKYTLQKIQEGFVDIGIDLSECSYMDSTFMGVLAALSKEIYNRTNYFLKVFCICPESLSHLKTTGLTRILDIKDECTKAFFHEDKTENLNPEQLEKKELTTHMLMAHKELIQLSEENKDRYESVVSLMEKSLKKQE
jgi:anti-anti-sigma factor